MSYEIEKDGQEFTVKKDGKTLGSGKVVMGLIHYTPEFRQETYLFQDENKMIKTLHRVGKD